ncbi:MAG: DUF4332 domain-containing protein [Gemmatimonadota bacterium]|jgi:predicted flap endonuclease-1-like 5' DNA nuclease
MAKLTTIEGIGEKLAEKLKKNGVGSTEKLLEKGATKKGRAEIAEASGIDEKRILKFVNHADLMRIKGVGGEYAELLEAAGVDTVAELARRNSDNLAKALEEANAKKSLVRVVPSAKKVAEWVTAAGGMDRVIKY